MKIATRLAHGLRNVLVGDQTGGEQCMPIDDGELEKRADFIMGILHAKDHRYPAADYYALSLDASKQDLLIRENRGWAHPEEVTEALRGTVTGFVARIADRDARLGQTSLKSAWYAVAHSHPEQLYRELFSHSTSWQERAQPTRDGLDDHRPRQ